MDALVKAGYNDLVKFFKLRGQKILPEGHLVAVIEVMKPASSDRGGEKGAQLLKPHTLELGESVLFPSYERTLEGTRKY